VNLNAAKDVVRRLVVAGMAQALVIAAREKTSQPGFHHDAQWLYESDIIEKGLQDADMVYYAARISSPTAPEFDLAAHGRKLDAATPAVFGALYAEYYPGSGPSAGYAQLLNLPGVVEAVRAALRKL
jgi:hypothetical protein